MNENKPKKTDLEIANDFDRLFDEIAEPETDTEIHDFLVEAGYDPENLKIQGMEFVNNIMASNWRFVSHNQIKSDAINDVPMRQGWNREQLTNAIQKLITALASGGQSPSLAFRNLEELTNTDLATILQELEYKARTSGIDFDLG